MKVLIVGAGPCGLLLALLLQKRGIQVQVLEASDKLDEQPRACHYAGPAKIELQRAGVLDAIAAEGFFPDGVSWRRKDGSRIVTLNNTDEPEESINRMMCLVLGRVIRILYGAAVESGCEVLMGHRVEGGIGEEGGKAWVDVVVDGDGRRRLEADYVVGCDGANSRVRRSMFGDGGFPGSTWDAQLIASNVYYPFETLGYDDSNFIVDQKDWYMAAKISDDGLWRLTYGDVPGLTVEEYTERLPSRAKEMIPHLRDSPAIRIANVGPYRMHQRLAKSMRSGRFLLAGDAAHLCNPFGGLGLAGGIADVGSLADALAGIHRGVADDSILDRYAELRAETYRGVIDPISTANFRRLWERDPATTAAEDEFFALIRKMSEDEGLARQFREGAMSVRSDLTQYYHQ